MEVRRFVRTDAAEGDHRRERVGPVVVGVGHHNPAGCGNKFKAMACRQKDRADRLFSAAAPPVAGVGSAWRCWNGEGTQCSHPAQGQPFVEPDGSACCYWDGYGAQCSHPAQRTHGLFSASPTCLVSRYSPSFTTIDTTAAEAASHVTAPTSATPLRPQMGEVGATTTRSRPCSKD